MTAAGGIDQLYVHCPDRLARNYAHQVLLLEEFFRAGVEVIFLNREVGQTPEDHLLLQVQGMIAEYERAKIMERSRRGKRHGAQVRRVSVLSCAPYGYRYVSKQDGGGEARIEILWEEARVVRQIGCRGWVETAALLGRFVAVSKRRGSGHALGKPSGIGRPFGGYSKTLHTRARLHLAKPLLSHCGHGCERNEGGRCNPSVRTPIMTFRLNNGYPFLCLQSLMPISSMRLPSSWKKTEITPVSNSAEHATGFLGLITCACCGYAYYGKPISPSARKHHERSYAYYRCIGSDAYRFGGVRICSNKQLRTDLVDEAVWEEVCRLLINPERLEQEYRRRFLQEQQTPDDTLVSLRHERAACARVLSDSLTVTQRDSSTKTSLSPG